MNRFRVFVETICVLFIFASCSNDDDKIELPDFRIPGPECLNVPNEREHLDPTPFHTKYWIVEDHGKSLENYRTSYDDFNSPDINNCPPQFDISYTPSKEDLKNLKISGSGQFSSISLIELVNKIRKLHHGDIAIVDLRSESHGYLNDQAVCPWSVRSWCNLGKSTETILSEENEVLHSFVGRDVYIHQTSKDSTSWNIVSAYTEQELCRTNGLLYKRFPTLDYVFPSDNIIEEFVNYVKSINPNTWLHFHCKLGKGRTTLFMCFYDMMRNPHLSLKDIIYRQYLIGGPSASFLFNDGSKETIDWKKEFVIEKTTLTAVFYEYVQNNWSDNYSVSFSQWKKKTYINAR